MHVRRCGGLAEESVQATLEASAVKSHANSANAIRPGYAHTEYRGEAKRWAQIDMGDGRVP